MASASDKLKTMALRHGEKVVVGLAAAVCVLLLFTAVSLPTITTTPEDVRKAASSAESNLNTRQPEADILKRLEEAGIKDPGFETLVDAQTKNRLDPRNYLARGPWITPEPGAGLIRETPELIAPTALVAYPGRGGALMYQLDANGERILDTGKDAEKPRMRLGRKKRRRRGAGGASSSMMAQSGGGPGATRRVDPRKEAEEKKAYEKEVARKQALITGKAAQSETADTAEKPEGPYKEVTKGLRWVVITGELDYKKLHENYERALKNPTIAYPHFRGLEVERQMRDTDGEWTSWEAVDLDENVRILDNLPEEEEELTPETARIDALVDPLPFLRAGYWERVHVGKFVAKEKIEVAKPAAGFGAEGEMMAGSSSMMANMSMSPAMAPPEMMASRSIGMGMMGGAGGGAGPQDDMNFEKEEGAEAVMLRSLDFTVEPDKTYRYRLRIVVFNPNRDREDVAPGTDTKAVELFGPWSEPTTEVTMPADVVTYALNKTTGFGRLGEQVHFQVIKWNPDDGVTVPKSFDAGPGDIVGDVASADIPSSDGTGKKNKKIDFNSRHLMLDATGGLEHVPQGLGNGMFDVPTLSLLMRPDGTAVVRNEAADALDEVRRDIDENYKKEVKESGKKKRQSSMGSSAMAPGR